MRWPFPHRRILCDLTKRSRCRHSAHSRCLATFLSFFLSVAELRHRNPEPVVRHKVRYFRGWGGKIRTEREREGEKERALLLHETCLSFEIPSLFLEGFCTAILVSARHLEWRTGSEKNASGSKEETTPAAGWEFSRFLRFCRCVNVCVCIFFAPGFETFCGGFC